MNIRRRFSTLLVKNLEGQIPKVKERVKKLVTSSGKVKVGEYDIASVIQGMKGINSVFYLGSSLDANEGIRFRGMTIPEMQKALPNINGQPLPEAVFWLLLTGRPPTAEEHEDIRKSLLAEKSVPASTLDLIKANAKSLHPMTLFSMAVMDMQRNSEFAQKYGEGKLKKDDEWRATLNDALSILRALPKVAGTIYATRYNRKQAALDTSDWSGHFANYMGFDKKSPIIDVLRAYLSIHTDHEGGNVSAHTAYLVSSALSDPFLSFAAGLNGLAGPLHGLANQEVMHQIAEISQHLQQRGLDFKSPDDPNLTKEIETYVRERLKVGVIYGYGHGKLRVTDPRFTAMKELSLKVLPNNRYVHIVHAMEKVATPVLKEMGKVKNPFPNVDAHSGALLHETGMKEADFYTVVFGVSRAIGILANIVWARALRLNIERPGSLTLEALESIASQNPATPAGDKKTKPSK